MGISGRIASAFLASKLTPLIVLASLGLGAFAVAVTPREEEPQIDVPMIDVMVSYPGASAREVEDQVTTPLEKLLFELSGVEYVYSTARPGGNLTIVRFHVGESLEESLVKVHQQLMANAALMPPGVPPPLVRPRTIDDVPVLALTLWSDRYDGYELRRVGRELLDELQRDPRGAETSRIGGPRRRVRWAGAFSRTSTWPNWCPTSTGARSSRPGTWREPTRPSCRTRWWGRRRSASLPTARPCSRRSSKAAGCRPAA